MTATSYLLISGACCCLVNAMVRGQTHLEHLFVACDEAPAFSFASRSSRRDVQTA